MSWREIRLTTTPALLSIRFAIVIKTVSGYCKEYFRGFVKKALKRSAFAVIRQPCQKIPRWWCQPDYLSTCRGFYFSWLFRNSLKWLWTARFIVWTNICPDIKRKENGQTSKYSFLYTAILTEKDAIKRNSLVCHLGQTFCYFFCHWFLPSILPLNDKRRHSQSIMVSITIKNVQ